MRAKLAGHGKPQCIGAPSRQMLLVTGGAKRRTHGAGINLAAVAVVVAHFHRRRKAAPCRPVERGVHWLRLIARLVAKKTSIIHA